MSDREFDNYLALVASLLAVKARALDTESGVALTQYASPSGALLRCVGRGVPARPEGSSGGTSDTLLMRLKKTRISATRFHASLITAVLRKSTL